MRVLTVRQPWAWAIIHGGKDVENRVRNLAGAYRGPVAIHAGLADFEQHNEGSRAHRAAHGGLVDTSIVYGGIIGVVDLADVHLADECSCACFGNPWAEFMGEDDEPVDIYHLMLASPRALAKAIPFKGALGLRELPTDVEAELLRRLA